MGKRIACVITDLFEDIEFTSPRDEFVKNGHEVVTNSSEKVEKVTGKQGDTTVMIEEDIDYVSESQFEARFMTGGLSQDVLRADERFVEFAKTFMNEKKPVMAICHGPQLLINAKTLKGRDVTGFTSIKVDLENAGANYRDEEVVVCQNQLVTSRTPKDLPAFNRESLNVLT